MSRLNKNYMRSSWVVALVLLFLLLWAGLSLFLRVASALVISAIISLVLLIVSLPPVSVFRHEDDVYVVAYALVFLSAIAIIIVYAAQTAIHDARPKPLGWKSALECDCTPCPIPTCAGG